MSDNIMIVETVDASGLACPMPVLKAKKGMDAISGGEVLELISTDKGSVKDVQEWARVGGHSVVSWKQDGNKFSFYIRKKSS